MDYTLGVDVGRQNYSKTALAIVRTLIRFTHPNKGDQWLTRGEISKTRDQWARNSGVWLGPYHYDPDWSDAFDQRIDWGGPRYELVHLGRFDSSAPHAKIIDELIALHATAQLKDNMTATLVINAVGQSFVDRFRAQAARKDVWCNPQAMIVRPGVGVIEGDSYDPGSVGLEELLGNLNVLMGTPSATGEQQVAARLNAAHFDKLRAAMDNQEEARFHYDADALMMQGRDRSDLQDGYDLLYAFAVAVWAAHHRIHGDWWFLL